MSVREVLKTITEETPIPIIVNNDTNIFLLESYVRGYHVYMNIWNATINDYLQCKIEENNEFDPSAVALLHDDCLEVKVAGHVPIHLSKIFHRFLKLPFCSISAVVIGKRVNHGAGDGLEIPVEYKFFGDARAASSAENQIKKAEKNVNILVKKMYEIIPIKQNIYIKDIKKNQNLS